MRTGRSILAALALCALVWQGHCLAADGEGTRDETPATARTQTPPSAPKTAADEKLFVKADVVYEIKSGELNTRMAYASIFARDGSVRLQGEAKIPELTGDEDEAIKIIMVGTPGKLEQLITLAGQSQLMVYDLAEIHREFPNVRLCRDMNPRRYTEILAKSKHKRLIGEERLGGEKTKQYSVQLGKEFHFAPIPGCPTDPPKPKRMNVWTAEDGLPRKVEAFGKDGGKFLTITFRNTVLLDKRPDKAFELSRPEDAIELVMTDVVLEMLRSRSGQEE